LEQKKKKKSQTPKNPTKTVGRTELRDSNVEKEERIEAKGGDLEKQAL